MLGQNWNLILNFFFGSEAQQVVGGFDAVDSELPSDAEILFSIPREVQIFYIGVTGEVSCPSYPSSLHIFRFKGNQWNDQWSVPTVSEG